MDETQVSVEFGRKKKVFGASDTHHGRAVAQVNVRGGKHVTALVPISASGRRAPPVFIVTGKNIMSNWFHPLAAQQSGVDEHQLWLTQKNWFPDDALFLMTESGSMEKRIIKLVIEHINKFVRQCLLPNLAYCLTLDGHKSREGTQWLEYCNEVKCEVVQSPSDTSHFLQPCDRKVKKTMKESIRNNRDLMCRYTFIDLHSMQNYANARCYWILLGDAE